MDGNLEIARDFDVCKPKVRYFMFYYKNLQLLACHLPTSRQFIQKLHSGWFYYDGNIAPETIKSGI